MERLVGIGRDKYREWDLVSTSLDGKALLTGGAKWLLKPPSVTWIHETINHLKSKGFPPIDRNPNATLYSVLFIPEKPKKIELSPYVHLVDAEEVIEALR